MAEPIRTPLFPWLFSENIENCMPENAYAEKDHQDDSYAKVSIMTCDEYHRIKDNWLIKHEIVDQPRNRTRLKRLGLPFGDICNVMWRISYPKNGNLLSPNKPISSFEVDCLYFKTNDTEAIPWHFTMQYRDFDIELFYNTMLADNPTKKDMRRVEEMCRNLMSAIFLNYFEANPDAVHPCNWYRIYHEGVCFSSTAKYVSNVLMQYVSQLDKMTERSENQRLGMIIHQLRDRAESKNLHFTVPEELIAEKEALVKEKRRIMDSYTQKIHAIEDKIECLRKEAIENRPTFCYAETVRETLHLEGLSDADVRKEVHNQLINAEKLVLFNGDDRIELTLTPDTKNIKQLKKWTITSNEFIVDDSLIIDSPQKFVEIPGYAYLGESFRTRYDIRSLDKLTDNQTNHTRFQNLSYRSARKLISGLPLTVSSNDSWNSVYGFNMSLEDTLERWFIAIADHEILKDNIIIEML